MDWVTFGTAFGLVFVAEFADKTQLVLLGFASRGKPLQVWLGAAAAFLVLTILAAWVGGLIASTVPEWVVTVLAAVLFLLFGVLALRDRDEDNDAPTVIKTGFLPAFGVILVAEMGDKTQLAVAALAASSESPVATAIGGTLALWVSAALAVLAGGWLARKVRPDLMRWITAGVFILLGLLLLVGLLLPVSII